MTFQCWIQRHDYASEDQGAVTLPEAIVKFREFDWPAELDAYEESDHTRNCPPGIGFHNGYDGSNPEAWLLHICPTDADTAFFNFHRLSEVRVLGLWSRRTEDVRYAEKVAMSSVPGLIRGLFALDSEAILQHCD